MHREPLTVTDGELRTPPARGYRLRLHTDAVSGPHWLTLLAVCAYLRGVIVVEKREAT